MTELPSLRAANTIQTALQDPSFVEALCRNTAEHIQTIIAWLLPGYEEPRIEDVATTVGSLLQASTELKWGIGDVLVAVDQRRKELYRPDEEWVTYLKQVNNMLGDAVGYHTLWSYYSVSSMVPPEMRRPDRSHTWYLELTYLVGAMLKSETMTREEKRVQKALIVTELLQDPDVEHDSILDMRHKKAAISRLPVSFLFDYPPLVKAVHEESGEVVDFLTFVPKPWTERMTEAIHHLLWGLGIMQRTRSIDYLGYPSLLRRENEIYVRTIDPEEGWIEELVGTIGKGELAKTVCTAALMKWRMGDE